MPPTSQVQFHFPVDEAVRWEAALLAYDRITAGVAPLADELIDAPLLTGWRQRLAPAIEPILIGQVEDHPLLPGQRSVATSRLLALDPVNGWARTTSRFYRLARCAE